MLGAQHAIWSKPDSRALQVKHVPIRKEDEVQVVRGTYKVGSLLMRRLQHVNLKSSGRSHDVGLLPDTIEHCD